VVFPDIDPFVFGLQYNGFGLRWYALAYVAGILLGWRYVLGLIRNQGLWGPAGPPATATQIDDLVLWVTLGIIVGGRLGSVIFYNPEIITRNPLEIFMIWRGGMSFHGGLIGVVVVMLLFSRINKVALLSIADLVAACQPIGQFFGRIANFVNGELYGRTTDVPWGMTFCNDTIRDMHQGTCPAGDLPRHPSQIYEALLEGLVLFLVLRLATHRLKWLQRPGAVTGLFLLGYAAFRILLENVREPDVGLQNLPYGLTMGMILSVPMALAGAFLMWRAFRNPAPTLAFAGPSATPAVNPPAAQPKAEAKPAAKPAPKPIVESGSKPKPAPKPKAKAKPAPKRTAKRRPPKTK
jgi:phosphatidylglycerol---prolipoprotein diacylglyceryl transferase